MNRITKEANLPLIPLVKSVYKKIKGEKKECFSIGVQAQIPSKDKHKEDNMLLLEQFVEEMPGILKK